MWKDYTTTGDLGELATPEARPRAVACLNELVTDALECVPECMQYMTMLKVCRHHRHRHRRLHLYSSNRLGHHHPHHPLLLILFVLAPPLPLAQTEEVFRFCAIPQVMAIATLADLYDNPKVFTGVVKIRKGMAAKLILDTKSTGGLHKWFYYLASDILRRVKKSDPSAAKTRQICRTIIRLTEAEGRAAIIGGYAQVFNAVCPVIIAASAYHLFGKDTLRPRGSADTGAGLKFTMKVPDLVTRVDFAAAVLFFGAIAFVLGYSIVSAGKASLRRADP